MTTNAFFSYDLIYVYRLLVTIILETWSGCTATSLVNLVNVSWGNVTL